MSEIAEKDFTENLFKLLDETFVGPEAQGPSAYLDKGSGLFQTLDEIDAAVASRQPYAGSTTIAAHVGHLNYYVRVLHNFVVGREQTIDWAASWHLQTVSTDEWHALRQTLRTDFENLTATLKAVERWGDEEVGDSMAIVVHTAYHLGALRQLLKFAERAQE